MSQIVISFSEIYDVYLVRGFWIYILWSSLRFLDVGRVYVSWQFWNAFHHFEMSVLSWWAFFSYDTQKIWMFHHALYSHESTAARIYTTRRNWIQEWGRINNTIHARLLNKDSICIELSWLLQLYWLHYIIYYTFLYWIYFHFS